MKLKAQRILITAGPTWVPIDQVRVISNMATGETGVSLAQKLKRLGGRVTLILGGANNCGLNRNIKIIRFKFFTELKEALINELRHNQYDIIIHSAAVSDYQPKRKLKGKLAAHKIYNLKLLPLPKIIRTIRRLAPLAKLVMFKLESGVNDRVLLRRAKDSLVEYQADLAVANRIHPRYRAFILGKDKIYSRLNSKNEMVRNLISLLKR